VFWLVFSRRCWLLGFLTYGFFDRRREVVKTNVKGEK
jgi:hypothetical protein